MRSAVGWAEMIREVVAERRMPPWHADPKVGHFSNDARLSDDDKELINKWVDNGAPEGDPKDLPPAPEFAEGWQIPKPDEVIYMADEPYDVPATGTVEYQRFVVDPGWTEDKWIKAMECMPGNPAVVHHIIVYLVPPGRDAQRPGRPAALELAGRVCPGPAAAGARRRTGPLRAEGLQAAVRDALHAQRHGAEGSQLRGLRVCRSQDGEEGSGRAERRQLHVQDSARRCRTTRWSRNSCSGRTRCC